MTVALLSVSAPAFVPHFFPSSPPSFSSGLSSSFKLDSLANEGVKVEMVDTVDKVQQACRSIAAFSRIVIDLEGINLCRDGRICIVQVACEDGTVYIFDVTTLGAKVFGSGLGGILASPYILKLIFDGRSDCDALYHQFRVQVFPLIDLQVAHISAFRPTSEFVVGLKTVLEKSSPWLTAARRDEIARIKQAGVALFAPEKGGSYQVWDERPLSPLLVEYAAVDVALLFQVYEHALANLPRGMDTVHKLMQVSKQRVDTCIAASIPTSGRERAFRDFDCVV